MRSPLRIGITLFLGLASSVLVLVFLVVCVVSVRSMNDIAHISSDVRNDNLPEILETQRSFIAIESLRRMAEVVYVADDIQTRRIARINAQSLATEAAFVKDSQFHRQAKELVAMIVELAGRRDAAHKNTIQLQELRQEFSKSVTQMAAYVPNLQVMHQVFQAFYSSTISLGGTGGLSERTIAQYEDMADNDAENFEFINTQCARYSVLYSALGPVCQQQRNIYAEYVETRTYLAENFTSSREQWQGVDALLREMRDDATSDAEFVTTEALTGIEDASRKAVSTSLIMFGAAIAFFLVYLVMLHRFLISPIRWTGKKLANIQHGLLHEEVPDIRIVELYHVASLLDRFSVHLADLTSQASQLAEDAAEKRDLENLMGAVFQVSVDGYGVWTPAKIYLANAELLRILGLKDLEELKEQWDQVGFTGRDKLQPMYDEIIAMGFLRREAYLQDAHGRSIPFEISYLPIKWQDDTCIFTYFRDLTEQKHTEAALRAAKDDAEAAARVKSEFLARMSHEIRTPMNGVLGLTHLALAGSPPPEQKKFLEKIQASARILLRVINDILDFSKMESGRFSLEHARFSFSDMLTTVADLFRAQAEEKGLNFSVDMDTRIPAYVVGDELRLSQVLLNLCGNALKFTEHGEVVLHIRLDREVGDTVYLNFAVTDTGVGMSSVQLEGLFQPFTQADTSTTRKYGGTGLGLVISKLLVEMMQGTIQVTSTPGRGSTFQFTIAVEKTDDQKVAIPSAKAEQTEASLEGLRILLAEDNEINQEIAVALLENLGVSALVAGSGAEALELLEKEDVDGILMDIQMPVMDGLTAAQNIRRYGRDGVRDLPIIAMTAHAMQEDREKSFAAGMNDHLTKPIDIQELRDKLRHWVVPVRNARTRPPAVHKI